MKKKYQLYSIGNALLDICYEVSDEFLQDNNLEKGVMTLIDTVEHNRLLEVLSNEKALHACGGSAANTAMMVAQLGADVFYACKVAADQAGSHFLDDLSTVNIHTPWSSQTRQAGHTGKCLVLTTPDAERTMYTFVGIAETLAFSELHAAALADSEYLYIEGFLVCAPSTRETAISLCRQAKQEGVKCALTLSDPKLVEGFREELLAILAEGVDILFCNIAEAEVFTGHTDRQAMAKALSVYAQTIIITASEQGAYLCQGTQVTHVPGFPCKPLDTVGAGDVFAGSVLYGLSVGQSVVEAIRFANFAAAQVVSIRGPRLGPEALAQITAKKSNVED